MLYVDMLRGTDRRALAHAGMVDPRKPLTDASFDDYIKVAAKIPTVRYMANVTLANVQATFDIEVERKDGEAQG